MAGIPMYAVIKGDIKCDILSKKLGYGAQIKTETELCTEYNVSRICVRRALEELVKEGYIKRIPGKGSYVIFSPINIFIGNCMYNLENEIKKAGKIPDFKIIEFCEVPVREVDPYDAIGLRLFMHLDDDSLVYHISRLWYSDGDEIALDSTYIPIKYFPSITRSDVEKRASLIELYAERFGCDSVHSQETLFGRAVSQKDAEILEMPEGAPTLKVMQVTYGQGYPIEYNYRIYKGEKVNCHLMLNYNQNYFDTI